MYKDTNSKDCKEKTLKMVMVIELSGHLRDELFQERGPTRDGPQQEPF